MAMTPEEIKKKAFDNILEHLRWMVREKMLKDFHIKNEEGLPHINITAIPCTTCEPANISTEKL